MKVFIWNEPYAVAYGGSFLFVVAETEEQARELAKTAPVFSNGFSHQEEPLGAMTLGQPLRVIDAPYAECYTWSE